VVNLLLALFDRSNLLEHYIELTKEQNDALLNFGYFEQSRFKRWCPVEVDSYISKLTLYITALLNQYSFHQKNRFSKKILELTYGMLQV